MASETIRDVTKKSADMVIGRNLKNEKMVAVAIPKKQCNSRRGERKRFAGGKNLKTSKGTNQITGLKRRASGRSGKEKTSLYSDQGRKTIKQTKIILDVEDTIEYDKQ